MLSCVRRSSSEGYEAKRKEVMALKVVKGVTTSQEELKKLHQDQQKGGAAPTAADQAKLAAHSATAAARLSESSVVSLRLSRLNSHGEVIRDAKEARAVADDVADRIRTDDKEALEAHGKLGTGSAREHLV
jgi:hypothetical protein